MNSSSDQPSSHMIPYLLLTFTSFAWASNVVIGRAIHADIPPVGLAFWRWILAFIIIVIMFLPGIKRNFSALKREWKYGLLLGLTGMAAFHTFVYGATHTTTALNAVLVISMSPTLIPVLSWLFWREKLSGLQVIGILISTIGMVTIVTKGDYSALGDFQFVIGDGFALIAMITWSCYTVLNKHRPKDIEAGPMLASSVFFAILLLIIPVTLEMIYFKPMPLTTEALITTAYVAIIPSVLAFFAFGHAVQQIGPNKAGLFIHLMPLFGALLSILFLGESLQIFHALGAGFIGIGLLVTTGLWKKSKNKCAKVT